MQDKSFIVFMTGIHINLNKLMKKNMSGSEHEIRSN